MLSKNRALLRDSAEAIVRSLRGKPNTFVLGAATLTSDLARTSCSTFLSAILRRTFDINNVVWVAMFGKASPRARDFAMAFELPMLPPVTHIKELRAGMLGAIRYDTDRGGMSGHCFIASEPPVMHGAHGALTKYRLMVIDSCRTSHGAGDTRAISTATAGGIGRGIMGIYADKSGKIVAYTWSMALDSEVMHNGQGQRISFADVPSEWLPKENQNG